MAKPVPGWVVASLLQGLETAPHFSSREYVMHAFAFAGKNCFISGMVWTFNERIGMAEVEIEEGNSILRGQVDAHRLVSVDGFPCDGRVFTSAPEVFTRDPEMLFTTENLGEYAQTGAPPKMREALKTALNAEHVGTIFKCNVIAFVRAVKVPRRVFLWTVVGK